MLAAIPRILFATPWGGRVKEIVATVAVATVIVGGASLIPNVIPPGGGTTPPGPANIWVSTGGNDSTCARGNSSFPCLSLNRAYAIAQCGDQVEIAGGSYSSQNISGSKSCSTTWTVGASSGVTSTSSVTFSVATNATVNLSGLTTSANFVTIQKGTGTDLNIGGWGVTGTGNNLIVKDADLTSDFFINPSAGTGPYDNVALVGGSMGGFDLVPGTFLAIYMQTCGGCTSGSVIATDVLIDGVDFHDIDTPNTSDHTGVIRVDGGYDRVIIRNSTFVTNLNVTTSAVQTTNIGTGGIDPRNFSLINNYFGAQGTSLRSMNFNSALSTCTNYRILYNTSTIPLYLFGCPSETGTITAGNAAPWPVGADCFGTHLKNYWSGANSGCGTDQWTSGSLGLSNFVPQPGSVLLQAGETTNCPATDHDGNTRPSPALTNCDVGAREVT